MLYLLEHKPTREIAVYQRKLNAVYDHIRYKRHQRVVFRECEEHLLEQHTQGRAILHPEQSGKLLWAARPGHSKDARRHCCLHRGLAGAGGRRQQRQRSVSHSSRAAGPPAASIHARESTVMKLRFFESEHKAFIINDATDEVAGHLPGVFSDVDRGPDHYERLWDIYIKDTLNDYLLDRGLSMDEFTEVDSYGKPLQEVQA